MVGEAKILSQTSRRYCGEWKSGLLNQSAESFNAIEKSTEFLPTTQNPIKAMRNASLGRFSHERWESIMRILRHAYLFASLFVLINMGDMAWVSMRH
jgi:hypothetical protein